MFLIDKEYWKVKTTKSKGKGVFAKKEIAKGTIIGDYMGRVIRTKDFDFKKEADNLYLMYYHDQASIYPDLDKPGIHLINHSCIPNCWIYTLHGHTLIFALKKILPSEELTISYLLPPQSPLCNPCPHICKCGNKICSGTFHLPEDGFKKWRMFQTSREKIDKRTKIKYGSELKPLPIYPKRVSDDYIKTVLLDLM